MDRLGMKIAAALGVLLRRPERWGAALGLAAMTGLTACQNEASLAYHDPPLSVEQRYPIALREEPVILEVPVARRSGALSATQRSEISAFMYAYREQASGPLVIRVPSGTRNEAAARHTVEEIHALAARADVPPASLAYRPYGRRTGSTTPPILLAYSGVKALAAECGDWSENIAVNRENKPYPNFGCAAQRNLAAMAANPRDLHTPRTMDPAPAERRQVVREKYIAGEPTGGQSEADDKGQVSTVGP